MSLTGVVLTGVVYLQAVKYLSHQDAGEASPIHVEMEGHVAFHIAQDGEEAVITFTRNGELVGIERRCVHEMMTLPILRALPQLSEASGMGGVVERLRHILPW